MEGWLYLIRSNRIGLQYSRKRYFVLKENLLNCFKNIPKSNREEPLKTALIDSYIRVTDNGRESFHRNVFYIFTLYNSSNHNDQLKLGARSSEEAAKWIQSLKEAAMKECPSDGAKPVQCSKSRRHSFRLVQARCRNRLHSIDWTVFTTGYTKRMTSDVIAPSPWIIFDCKNGLRLFKEAKNAAFLGMHWDDHPAIMAVGVVDAPSEVIFKTLMSFGLSRSEWDFCLAFGSVVEHLDGHTDIIYKKLNRDWLPWGMKRRDLLLRRYWRREDDGTYVIVYHSVYHPDCPPKRGYIRVSLKSGGYVISPANQEKHSVVKHMLAIDWRFWKPYSLTSSSKYITIRMLARVAALREFFQAKHGNYLSSNFSSSERTREILSPLHEKEYIKEEVKMASDSIKGDDSEEDLQVLASPKHAKIGGSIVQLNDAVDEFFDLPDESDCDESEAAWPPNEDAVSQEQRHPMLTTAAVLVKKLQDLSGQRRGYAELKEASVRGTEHYSYGTTLPNDSSCMTKCSWSTADPSSFLVRGESYLKDHKKVKASSTLMKMVGADWLKSDKREDDLAGRVGGIVQRHALHGSSDFFFVINIQVPGLTAYNLAFYYVLDTSLEDFPLLESFVKGDDAYKNSRFKLIPYISTGSWIVKQSVGKKACLLGQALEINYFSGRNYLELCVDVGSSTVARGVASLVLSYLNNLVIEMAFVIQGNSQEELPEFLLPAGDL
ncbi:protein ENHANCED DISEASE RESISTANCE 2-like [Phalaenopsis equestris]|uniref:protein ENHANCED DISEASE RESISTANCE 2-like n=1 Tax=Phalaenopsis equestris TaxID=78828 RepID=UPI0009E34301|nr:protein ENHANCED DISEASE RESISTANCE 2-like [Phalaenopsis equestris]